MGSGRDRAYQGIRANILDLTLPPGSLLSENELAGTWGVSRTPVREALVLLAQEGLVQVYPKIGTFVSRVDLAQVVEAQFFREAVEMASLASLTPPYDEAVLRRLRENLTQQDGVGDGWAGFFTLDETFHSSLMALGGHEASWKFVAAAKGHLDRARWLGLATLHDSAAVRIAEHHAIFDAVEADHRQDAADLLRKHLRNVFADIEQIKAASPELFATDQSAQPVRRTVVVWQ
ncbi:MAG: GntR family transcriptional regulator [Micrococcales bacterium]|nr:GntR family transcriptional regulator [Micrococcales bacterium]